jgi:hypothetical protein
MTIIKENNKLTFNIYRKATTKNSIIHKDSYHPNENKKSAINNLINRLNTYPFPQESKDHELTVISEILKNDGYQQTFTTFYTKQCLFTSYTNNI